MIRGPLLLNYEDSKMLLCQNILTRLFKICVDSLNIFHFMIPKVRTYMCMDGDIDFTLSLISNCRVLTNPFGFAMM